MLGTIEQIKIFPMHVAFVIFVVILLVGQNSVQLLGLYTVTMMAWVCYQYFLIRWLQKKPNKEKVAILVSGATS